MRNNILLLAMFVCTLLACVPNNNIEYVKYESEVAVPRISAEDAKKEMDAGTAFFVDSRGAGAPDRLPGSIGMFSNADPEKFSELPKGKKIIVYCS